MAQGLFVTTKDMATFTPMNGSIDVDKITQYMKLAHDIHLQNYLGTDLFDKIGADIVASTLIEPYATLVSKYIKPMALWYGFYEYLKFGGYSVSNQGIYKHTSENSESVDLKEVDSMEDKALIIADNYAKVFVDYICFNSASFPEYNTNSNGDIDPAKDVNFSNWFL
jgi:hypothetical protein